MRKLLYILLLMFVASCVGNTSSDAPAVADSDTMKTIVNIVDTAVAEDTTLLALTPQQVDSLMFRITHHYSENFNFIVKADSLTLVPRDGDVITDTCRIYDNDAVVVAAIKFVPNDTIDSIWVKVAHDQMTMGWIPEHELLKGVTPDDPISQILDVLSNSRVIWMSALVAIGFIAFFIGGRKRLRKPLVLQFDQMDSIYPPLFIVLVAIMASLYASVQNFVPEFWQEYYYNPTLNPLVLPPLMATLVVMAWLLIITFIAIIDEVYHHFYFLPGITYIAEILGLAMLTYLVISWSTLFYFGYLLLPMLIAGIIWFKMSKFRS